MRFDKSTVRFLAFGLVTALLSSFGQTYLLGVYKPAISAEFGFDNSDFGFYYLVVTLGSAIGLNRLGHLIDRIALPRYMTGLVLLLALACLGMFLSGPMVTVFAAMLGLRLLGQGLMTHAAMTSMSRYFGRARGRAVAVAGLGMPLGQAVLPAAAVYLMTRFAWRESWGLFAAGLVFVGLPLILWLLKDHDARHASWLEAEARADADGRGASGPVWRRKDVIRDPRFYMILPSVIAMPFWVTMVFFFAENLAASKGWTLQALTGFYWFHAVGFVTVPFIGGYLIDRFGGLRLLPVYPPILATALVVAALAHSPVSIALFMALLGMAAGLAIPVNNAMWAELYGTKYLGEIKSLATSLAVFSTALSPFLLGALLDGGVTIPTLLFAGAVHGVAAPVLATLGLRRRAASLP
ncbi:MFS transporter [Kordiimonas marina]|uniref:MFS transporter n=1 Tax=Kordiimonas marina TaxID=2872312 RepID=UPI001FF4F2F3|nr:MFS transporter [Kordiimonas marina]MCJ9429781.1 MFS transporter [Kordiimonas marina]